MKKEWTEEELKEVAQQLSHPDGETGQKTGERMNDTNAYMIEKAIKSVSLVPEDIVLELGPGNGAHLVSVYNETENVKYFGLDISETMVQEATRINAPYIAAGKATFAVTDGQSLQFADSFFHKIFTVNTVYFWGNPLAYAKEIYRTLKPDGVFSLVFADKSFMEKLPFTKFGFQLYDKEDAGRLLTDAGFEILSVSEEIELTKGNLGQEVERPIIVLLATKKS